MKSKEGIIIPINILKSLQLHIRWYKISDE